MNSIAYIRQHILSIVQEKFQLSSEENKQVVLNFNNDPKFGDLSLNAAFIIAGTKKAPTSEVAAEIAEILQNPIIDKHENKIAPHIKSVSIAGNGFININLTQATWRTTAHELVVHPATCFKLFNDEPRYSYLIEFVSANPTGPLSLAHGRNAIIGDTLARVLTFLGHKVTKEFYVNDTGKQIKNLGLSLKKKVFDILQIPHEIDLIEYDNEYMDALAQQCAKDLGESVKNFDDSFFQNYAKNYFLAEIKQDLEAYRVTFDNWVSEEELHKSGKIEQVLSSLEKKGLIYESENATWFASASLGDEKDRVLIKSDSQPTYLLPDIAYHKTKFTRNVDFVIDILGQDHHGCEGRLHAAMQALGFDSNKLKLVFYQLVLVKHEEKFSRMSKRKGNFHSLHDVIELVGTDVARYFYLNRKNDAHLSFDLELALTQTDENPVFYIQYAYVRTLAILNKAVNLPVFENYVNSLLNHTNNEVDSLEVEYEFGDDEIHLLKKVCLLRQVLIGISQSLQPHTLANYTMDLAQDFHTYYSRHKILDENSVKVSNSRLLLTFIIKNTLALCFDLLGISKPERM